MFLVCEDSAGGGVLLNALELHELAQQDQLDFIFVSATNSRVVGELLHSLGALVVVCLDRDSDERT